MTSSLGRPGCRPRAPVAEGGPVGLSDGGEPTGLVPQGPGSGRIGIVTLFTAFILDHE